jgi:hypothetical protein
MLNRIKRPDTWLPRPSCNTLDLLDNPEPSTHGPWRLDGIIQPHSHGQRDVIAGEYPRNESRTRRYSIVIIQHPLTRREDWAGPPSWRIDVLGQGVLGSPRRFQCIFEPDVDRELRVLFSQSPREANRTKR